MQIYLVGGWVRDYKLGLYPKDADFVVVGSSPDEMLDLGYKEYRVRFVDYINGCKTGCNGKYNSLRDYLSDIKSGFNGEEYNLYAEPYNNDSRVSVYIRKGFLTWSQAEKVRQHFVSIGFAVKVVGVKGTEIYK